MAAKLVRKMALAVLALVFAGCAGTTTVNKEHPLYVSEPDANTVRVYFLRPIQGETGVFVRPISVLMMEEKVVSLARGDYCLVRMQPFHGIIFVRSDTTVLSHDGRNVWTVVTEEMPVEFLPGRTYYVVVRVWRASGEGNRYVPDYVSPEEAALLAAELKPVAAALEEPIR